jgi:hypothetical protein
MGRLLANRLFEETRGRECTFDELDACLHAKYAFRNLNTIKWVTKKDVKWTHNVSTSSPLFFMALASLRWCLYIVLGVYLIVIF